MLRKLVVVFAVLLMLGGLWLTACGIRGPGLYALGFGILTILGTLFERWRYRKYEPAPGGGWQATGERFADPTTGKDIEVFYDPVSGERRYVER